MMIMHVCAKAYAKEYFTTFFDVWVFGTGSASVRTTNWAFTVQDANEVLSGKLYCNVVGRSAGESVSNSNYTCVVDPQTKGGTVTAKFDTATDAEFRVYLSMKPKASGTIMINAPITTQPAEGDGMRIDVGYEIAPPRRECNAYCKRNGATAEVGASLCVCCAVTDDKHGQAATSYTTCGTYI